MDDILPLGLDELLTTTRSVRKRLDFSKPVERETIQRCIEIAIQAPTPSNLQNWHFVVVTELEKRRALADLYRKEEKFTSRYRLLHQTWNIKILNVTGCRRKLKSLLNILTCIFKKPRFMLFLVSRAGLTLLSRLRVGVIRPIFYYKVHNGDQSRQPLELHVGCSCSWFRHMLDFSSSFL